MTRRDRMLLLGLVPVLVLGALWLLALSPKRQEAQRLDDDLAAAQTRLVAAQGQVAQYEQARRELVANVRALADAGRAVPANAGIPALLRQLEDAGRRSGIDLETISTADAGADAASAPVVPVEPTATGATPVTITLSFDGRFFAVQRFFARLDRLVRVSEQRVAATGRLVSVEDVTLSSRAGRVTAQVRTSVHVLPDVTAALAAAEGGGPAAAPDVVADPAAASPGTMATAGVSP